MFAHLLIHEPSWMHQDECSHCCLFDEDIWVRQQPQAGSATAALKKMAEEQEEARELAEMRKGGFLTGSGAAAAGTGGAAAGKLEAAPGARRVRRTIVTVSADGERSTRNVIYSDRDKVCILHFLPGFG